MATFALVALALIASAAASLAVIIGRSPPGRLRRPCGGFPPERRE